MGLPQTECLFFACSPLFCFVYFSLRSSLRSSLVAGRSSLPRCRLVCRVCRIGLAIMAPSVGVSALSLSLSLSMFLFCFVVFYFLGGVNKVV